MLLSFDVVSQLIDPVAASHNSVWMLCTKTQPGLGLHSLQGPVVTTVQVAETASLVVLPLSCCRNCCAVESVVTPPCVTVGDGQEV